MIWTKHLQQAIRFLEKVDSRYVSISVSWWWVTFHTHTDDCMADFALKAAFPFKRRFTAYLDANEFKSMQFTAGTMTDCEATKEGVIFREAGESVGRLIPAVNCGVDVHPNFPVRDLKVVAINLCGPKHIRPLVYFTKDRITIDIDVSNLDGVVTLCTGGSPCSMTQEDIYDTWGVRDDVFTVPRCILGFADCQKVRCSIYNTYLYATGSAGDVAASMWVMRGDDWETHLPREDFRWHGFIADDCDDLSRIVRGELKLYPRDGHICIAGDDDAEGQRIGRIVDDSHPEHVYCVPARYLYGALWACEGQALIHLPSLDGYIILQGINGSQHWVPFEGCKAQQTEIRR